MSHAHVSHRHHSHRPLRRYGRASRMAKYHRHHHLKSLWTNALYAFSPQGYDPFGPIHARLDQAFFDVGYRAGYQDGMHDDGYYRHSHGHSHYDSHHDRYYYHDHDHHHHRYYRKKYYKGKNVRRGTGGRDKMYQGGHHRRNYMYGYGGHDKLTQGGHHNKNKMRGGRGNDRLAQRGYHNTSWTTDHEGYNTFRLGGADNRHHASGSGRFYLSGDNNFYLNTTGKNDRIYLQGAGWRQSRRNENHFYNTRTGADAYFDIDQAEHVYLNGRHYKPRHYGGGYMPHHGNYGRHDHHHHGHHHHMDESF